MLLAAAPAGAVGADARATGAAEPGPGPAVDPVPAAPLPAPPGRTSLLSKARNGGFPNGVSREPSMSANARFVAFTSVASNLVANDEEGSVEVFVLDRRTGRYTRAPLPEGIARNPGAVQSEPAISADGRVVAYTYRPAAAAVGTRDGPVATFVLAWNRDTGNVQVVSRNLKGGPQGGARQPSISSDGRYVAYTSTVSWTQDNDDNADDVFRFDRRTETTIHLSGPWYNDGESISGFANSPSISGDGNLVAFASDGGDSVVDEDTGSGTQVFVRDVEADRTSFVSRATDGRPPRADSLDPAISGNGRYVFFASRATNLTPEGGPGLFRHDRRTGDVVMVSVTPTGAAAAGASAQPSTTPDGNFVAWTSNAPDLVPETAGRIVPAATSRIRTEVYIRDIALGETLLVSVSRANTGSAGQSYQPAIGGAGRFIAFASDSEILVADDDNETYDVFLRDLPPSPVIRPATLDLGSRDVGTESLSLAATLGNAGWSPLTVTGTSISGTNRKDFRIVADGCDGRVLRRNEACSVSVVFKPTGKGARSATLNVADNASGSPRTVRLRGRATEVKLAQTKLELKPDIGKPGIVTIATGSGFPPGARVTLSWSTGITPKLGTIVADDGGRFSVPVLVFHNDVTGPRELRAAPATGADFPSAAASMLVTKPPLIPPRFDITRLLNLPLILVFRG